MRAFVLALGALAAIASGAKLQKLRSVDCSDGVVKLDVREASVNIDGQVTAAVLRAIMGARVLVLILRLFPHAVACCAPGVIQHACVLL